MAYSDFTLETVREEFQLETIESAKIFADIEPVPPSEALVIDMTLYAIERCDKILGILSSMVNQKA